MGTGYLQHCRKGEEQARGQAFKTTLPSCPTEVTLRESYYLPFQKARKEADPIATGFRTTWLQPRSTPEEFLTPVKPRPGHRNSCYHSQPPPHTHSFPHQLWGVAPAFEVSSTGWKLGDVQNDAVRSPTNAVSTLPPVACSKPRMGCSGIQWVTRYVPTISTWPLKKII